METDQTVLGKQRRLLWHGFLMLTVGLSIGFIVVGGPHPKTWMAAHVSTMLGSLVGIAMALVWPQLNLSEGQRKWSFRLILLSLYTGTLLNIFAAAAEVPGPATSPGINPEPWQAMIFFPVLFFLLIGFFGSLILTLKGLKGRTQ